MGESTHADTILDQLIQGHRIKRRIDEKKLNILTNANCSS